MVATATGEGLDDATGERAYAYTFWGPSTLSAPGDYRLRRVGSGVGDQFRAAWLGLHQGVRVGRPGVDLVPEPGFPQGGPDQGDRRQSGRRGQGRAGPGPVGPVRVPADVEPAAVAAAESAGDPEPDHQRQHGRAGSAVLRPGQEDRGLHAAERG